MFDSKIALPRHVLASYDRASSRNDFTLAVPSRYHSPGAHLILLAGRNLLIYLPTYLPTYVPNYLPGRFYLAESVKKLLQVGQNWKMELQISFRSLQTIWVGESSLSFSLFLSLRLSVFFFLFCREFIEFDLIREKMTQNNKKRECSPLLRKTELLIIVW